MSDPALVICATCQRVLDLYTDDNGVEYQHTLQDSPADHEPVPINAPADYRGGRCDFCDLDAPEFVLPIADFDYPVVRGHASLGDWAACTTCANLIDSNRWNALITRVIAVKEQQGLTLRPDTTQLLGALYRRLRRNITGPLRPIHPKEGPHE